MKRTGPVVLLGICACAALIVFVGTASADIYWSNLGAKTIGHARDNGSEANNDFVTTADTPCGVAANETYVYWAGTTASTGFVGRASLAGRKAENEFISIANPLPCGVAVDASHIYFNNYILGTIGRASLAGGEIENKFIEGGTNPQHPSVGGGHIFWTNKGYKSNPEECAPGCSIGTAAINGNPASVDQQLIVGTHDPPSGTATDGTYVYWGNGSAIGRAGVDGKGVEPEFIKLKQGFVCALAVNQTHIYWGVGGAIGRASLAGAEINEHLVTTPGATCGVAVTSSSAPASKVPTSTQVQCDYFVATFSDTCTVKVSDAGAGVGTAPAGEVKASLHGGGAFTGGNTCALSASAPGSRVSTCTVEFVPPAAGAPLFVAEYKGHDGVHAPSSGHTKSLVEGLGSIQLLSSIGLSSLSFPAAPSGPAITARRFGTTIHFVLRTAAAVHFSVQRPAVGVRRRGRCVAPGRHGAGAKRCKRYVTLPRPFGLVARSGAHDVHFSGRLAGRRLRPGSYRLLVRASVAGALAAPRTLRFRIVP